MAAALEVLEADDEPFAQGGFPRLTRATPAPLTASTLRFDAIASSGNAKPAEQPLPTTLASLAALPAASIVALLPTLRASSPSLGLSSPSEADLAEMHGFMDALEAQGLEASQVKQKLGERLFKVVKREASARGLKGGVRRLGFALGDTRREADRGRCAHEDSRGSRLTCSTRRTCGRSRRCSCSPRCWAKRWRSWRPSRGGRSP